MEYAIMSIVTILFSSKLEVEEDIRSQVVSFFVLRNSRERMLFSHPLPISSFVEAFSLIPILEVSLLMFDMQSSWTTACEEKKPVVGSQWLFQGRGSLPLNMSWHYRCRWILRVSLSGVCSKSIFPSDHCSEAIRNAGSRSLQCLSWKIFVSVTSSPSFWPPSFQFSTQSLVQVWKFCSFPLGIFWCPHMSPNHL